MALKDHWFYGMVKSAQRAYIVAHPNSKYARSAKGKDRKAAKSYLKDLRDEHLDAVNKAIKKHKKAERSLAKLRKKRRSKTNPMSIETFRVKFGRLKNKMERAERLRMKATRKLHIVEGKLAALKIR